MQASDIKVGFFITGYLSFASGMALAMRLADIVNEND
jgi:hypothetical protein